MRRHATLRRAGYAAVLAGTALAAGGLYRSYRTDIGAAYARIDALGAERVETSVGPVEYLRTGDGVPVLVAHGIVGGCDQALTTGRELLGPGFDVIGPSRFGYLGSPLPDDPSPENQARAYAELLDELGVERALVLGVSAGGAPAIAFALRYPDRTRGLVLVGAATPSEGIDGPTGPPGVLLRDVPFWLLCTYGRTALLGLFGLDRDDLRAATPAERAEVETLIATLLPVEPRRRGVLLDARVTNRAMAERRTDFDARDLPVPVLVIHARDDPLASFEDAVRLVERAPDADLLAFEEGGHLLFGHGDAIDRRIDAFVAATA